ncbi:MAG: hypothetical protein EWV82_06330, partial [Microcystis aeruginosa Ma_AC_P_19900807_S299]
MTKIHPKKLLVEGREEMRVIPELAEAHGISWGEKKDTAIIYIKPADGIDNLLDRDNIYNEINDSGLTHLGIIIDADEEPDNRWQSLYNACLPNIPNLPQNLPAAGLIITLESGIKFGVWMMPDNQSRGMLETFLAYLVPDNNLWQYTQNKVIEAKQQGATYRDYHL